MGHISLKSYQIILLITGSYISGVSIAQLSSVLENLLKDESIKGLG